MHNPDRTLRLRRLRWIVWGTLCVAFLVTILHRSALAVMADQLMQAFDMGAAAFGGLVAVYFYIYTVMQLPAGVLADYLGPRRTASAGLLVAGVAAFLFAAATNLTVAYIGRFLVAFGVSVVFISVMKIQANWFHSREFGVISGLTAFIGNLGYVLATLPLALLTGALGWRGAYSLTGGLTLALGILMWVLVRDRPTDLGLPAPEEVAASRPVSILASMGVVMRNPVTWWASLGMFGMFGAHTAFVSMWGVPFLMHSFGMERATAATYVMMATLGAVTAGPVIGYLSDRVLGRRLLPYALFIMVYVLAWVPFLVMGGDARLVPFLGPLMFLKGAAWVSFVLNYAVAKEVNHPELAGIALGTVNTVAFLSPALLQPFLGWVLDKMWDGTVLEGVRIYPVAAYQVVAGITAGIAALTLIAVARMPETFCRSVYTAPTAQLSAERR